MQKATSIILISEAEAADGGVRGVKVAPEATERELPCTIKSVGMTEMYTAMAHDMSPSIIAVLANDFEYHEETLCLLEGVRYRVLRTYQNQAGGIELTLAKAVIGYA